MQQSEPKSRHINALKSRRSKIDADNGKDDNDDDNDDDDGNDKDDDYFDKGWQHWQCHRRQHGFSIDVGSPPQLSIGPAIIIIILLVIGKSFSGIDMGNGYQNFRKNTHKKNQKNTQIINWLIQDQLTFTLKIPFPQLKDTVLGLCWPETANMKHPRFLADK